MKRTLVFCCFLFASIVVISAQQESTTGIIGKYFRMSLPDTWHETDSHVYLDQIISETGISQSQADSTFKCYVDSQNYYNVLIIGEKFHSRRTLRNVTIEQLIGRSGEKREYNGLDFLITNDPFSPSLTGISANAIYEDATFYFLFILDNENLDMADKTLSSISFIGENIEEENVKKDGFFSGIWHGIRTPFVFIINFFRKNKIIIFSDSRNVGYTIGYLLGIIFILSGIFGGSRRRN
jgi:hypothetical protein